MLRYCFESVVTSHFVLNLLMKMTIAGGEFSFYAEKFKEKKVFSQYLKLAKVMCPAAYSDYSAYTCCLLHFNPALVASYHASFLSPL